MATSIEESDLHRRIALATIKHVGSSPGLLMLGIMSSTSMLSMWISNTATTAMMIPILEMVVGELNELDVKDRTNRGEQVQLDQDGR